MLAVLIYAGNAINQRVRNKLPVLLHSAPFDRVVRLVREKADADAEIEAERIADSARGD